MAEPPVDTDTNFAEVGAPDREPRSRGGWLTALIALVAIIVAGIALWQAHRAEQGITQAGTALRGDFADHVEALQRTVDQRKREFDTLRARFADADSVDKGIRSELLSLSDRSRRLEDAVANLADQRVSGRDALAANEAEFLLQLGNERLKLFRDADGALAAYRLADSALASAADPAFTSVRQTIADEMHAVAAAKPADVTATLAALEHLRDGLAALPPRQHVAPAASAESPSRVAKLFGRFVQIERDSGRDEAARTPELDRALAGIDIRAAEAALLARDPAAWKAALARVRADLTGAFDAGDGNVKASVAVVDRLSQTPLAPSLPELGMALQELRNLRTTRALAQPPPAAPAPAPGTPEVPANPVPPNTATPPAQTIAHPRRLPPPAEPRSSQPQPMPPSGSGP